MARSNQQVQTLAQTGYQIEQFEVGGLIYFRWRLGVEHGGGYDNEHDAWKEAARHRDLTAERERQSH